MAFFAFAVILALKITLTLSPSWDNGAAKCLVNCWANTVLCSSAILVLMLKDSWRLFGNFTLIIYSEEDWRALDT